MDSQFTIVIADDHPLFRGALYQAVHMAIDEARLLEADSIDSLTHLLAEHPEVDLLLLDLKDLRALLMARAISPDLCHAWVLGGGRWAPMNCHTARFA